MDAWVVWIIAAGVLAGAELLSLDLVLIMLAGGAAAGGITALAGGPPVVQFVVAIAATLALLLAVRPIAKRHLLPHSTVTGAEALVGKHAIVLSQVDAEDGRVRLNGGEWSARSFDSTQVIAVGASVQVMQISGATAVVWDSKQ